jgi:hypothetical protein
MFEDFLGATGSGLYPWLDSGTGLTDGHSTGGAGNFFGTCRLVTGATVGNARTRSLGISTSTIFANSVIRYGFALPDTTNVSINFGFSGGGSSHHLFYSSAANSGQWVLSTTAGVVTFTSAVPNSGNYLTGKRYQLEMERISTTQTRILLEIADWNLFNWSTVYSGTITHAAVNIPWGVCTPSFTVTALANSARSVIVDWCSLYIPSILR